MGCKQTKNISKMEGVEQPPPIVMACVSLPNYWENRDSFKISKESNENIKNVSEELGV